MSVTSLHYTRVENGKTDEGLHIYATGTYMIIEYDAQYYPGEITDIKANKICVNAKTKCGKKRWKQAQSKDNVWCLEKQIIERIEGK